MPSRRDHSLEYWLARRQRRRLMAAWSGFWEALAEVPRNQKLAELHRAKMPPGGLAWPFWTLVLNGWQMAPAQAESELEMSA